MNIAAKAVLDYIIKYAPSAPHLTSLSSHFNLFASREFANCVHVKTRDGGQ